MSTAAAASTSTNAVTLVSRGHEAGFSTLLTALEKVADGDTIVLELGMHSLGSSQLVVARKSLSIVSREAYERAKEPPAAQKKLSREKGKETMIVGCERGQAVVSVMQRGSLRIEGVAIVFFPRSFIALGPNENGEEDDEENMEKYDAVVEVKNGDFSMRAGVIAGKVCHGLLIKKGTCALEDVVVDGMPPALFPAGLSDEDYSEADLALLHGIIISRNAVATITNSLVENCFWNGIYAFGEVTLSNNMISMNRKIGLEASSSSATVLNSTFHQNGFCGILMTQSTSIVTGCTFTSNRKFGLLIAAGSRPKVTDCVVLRNQEAGMLVVASGGVIEKCEIFDNGKLSGNGVTIHLGQAPIFIDCVIHTNLTHGVEISESSRATFRGCHIHTNKATGVRVWENSTAFLQDSNVIENAKDGVVVFQNGKGQFIGNSFSKNGGSGLRIESQGFADIECCKFSANKTFGVYAVGAEANLSKNTFDHSGQSAVSVGFEATVMMVGNQLAGRPTGTLVNVSQLASTNCSFKNNIITGEATLSGSCVSGFRFQ